MSTTVPSLTARPAWKSLEAHYQEIRDLHLRKLFADDPGRGERMTAEAVGIYLDYSKNRVTNETLKLLLQLAEEVGLRADRRHVPGRENQSHGKPRVLHVAFGRREMRRSSWTAKMWRPRSTPCWTRWRISPARSAVATGRAIRASASAT